MKTRAASKKFKKLRGGKVRRKRRSERWVRFDNYEKYLII